MTLVEFILYSDISENVSVNAAVKDETIWLTKLFRKGEVTIKNQFKQLGANELEKLRVNDLTGLGNSIRLLLSSNNDDWWSNENIAKKYICYGEVITLGRARYANL